MQKKSTLLAAALLVLTSPQAPAQNAAHHSSTDSAAVTAVVDRFHAALSAGDSAAALTLLTPDVMILEAGAVETLDEYRSHHLAGDIAFAQAIKSERQPVQVRIRGDVGWVISSSSTQGTYRDRTIDSLGVELVLLTRAGDRWLISAIHWSLRRRPQ